MFASIEQLFCRSFHHILSWLVTECVNSTLKIPLVHSSETTFEAPFWDSSQNLCTTSERDCLRIYPYALLSHCNYHCQKVVKMIQNVIKILTVNNLHTYVISRKLISSGNLFMMCIILLGTYFFPRSMCFG